MSLTERAEITEKDSFKEIGEAPILLKVLWPSANRELESAAIFFFVRTSLTNKNCPL